jgi:(2Fe-2S) ferredoxin
MLADAGISSVMMTQPKLHLFVCQNDRPEGGHPSCGARGAAAVLGALQRAVGSDLELSGRVALTPCGCLGPCFDGPTLVVYPDAVWYAGVTASDVAEIVEQHLRRGQVVERLRLAVDAEDAED